MPQTLSAKKSLRSSLKKKADNNLVRLNIKKALRAAKKKISLENVGKAASTLDKAVKKKVIHKNKAARIKRRLFLLLTKSGKVHYTGKSKHAQKPDKPPTQRRIRKKASR